MACFKIEVMDAQGKVIEKKHVELSCTTVQQACSYSVVSKMKRDAKNQGLVFRVKIEEE